MKFDETLIPPPNNLPTSASPVDAAFHLIRLCFIDFPTFCALSIFFERLNIPVIEHIVVISPDS